MREELLVPSVEPVMSGASQWRRVVRDVLLAGTSESIIMRTALPVWLKTVEEMLGGKATSMRHVSGRMGLELDSDVPCRGSCWPGVTEVSPKMTLRFCVILRGKLGGVCAATREPKASVVRAEVFMAESRARILGVRRMCYQIHNNTRIMKMNSRRTDQA